ncbi:MAG: hypothetical protein KGJ94_06340 [Xanthomonadaceae bacterium]|nr:hypothetical protein [Xanthomonadaceae bacterium]
MLRQGRLASTITLALVGLSGGALAQTYTPPDQANPVSTLVPATTQTPPFFDYAIGLGYEHTDNIDRVTTNPTGQDILQPTLSFTFNQQGSTIQAQAVGLIQYTDYLQGYFGNEFRGQLSGVLNWTISPQRLNFDVEDYSSVQPVDTRRSNSPANQQQVNIFVSGPTLSFKLGNALRGEADLRYINTTASKTKAFNSQRGLGALRVIRDLSTTASLSGNFEAVNVDFNNIDPLINTQRYTEYNVYARYQSQLAHLDMDLALGGSQVDFSHDSSSHSGALVRAALAWRLTSRSSLQVNASDQLDDSTANLVQPPNLTTAMLTDPTLQVGRTVISPAVFRDRSVNLGYLYRGPRFGFTLTPYYSRLRQLNGSDLSRNGHGVVATASYLIRPLLTLGVNVGDQTTEYTSDHSRDRDRTYGVNLTRQLTPHWSWSIAFSHDGRHSTRSGFGYNENQVFAILYYRR